MIRRVIIIFFLGMLFQRAYAKLVLPKIIGHNMVLQQGVPVAIWGWANQGDKVSVAFKGKIKTAIADDNGAWKVYLDPMKASFDAALLTITTLKEEIQLKNVLVGEVWLCSGQSNMEFAMRKLEKLKPPPGVNWPVDEVEKADNEFIRTFLVERKKMQPDSAHAGWSLVTDPTLRQFSEVAYFFAKELNGKLKVPVGVISAAIPGSGIEPWMPEEAMLKESFFRNKNGDSTRKISGDAGKFYTSMIAPLIPFSLKGFCWYQGENNCFLKERLQYSYKMKALINYWREKWNSAQLPFYYIQIAPYYYSKAKDRAYTVYSEPEFWEAQSVVLKVPNTVMIATIDLNDDPADLHPVNKWEVGKRLAQSTLSKTYKVSSAPAMGPVYKSAIRRDNSFVIDFDYKGKGLKSSDGKPLSFFEIADADGNYHAANASIKDNKVWVNAKNVAHPKSVRFAWREDATPNLYNAEGLPTLPFRTNNPIVEKFY